MSRLHVLLFTVLAMFALAAAMASSAIAFKELLWNGTAFTKINLAGELTLTSLSGPAILCPSVFDLLTEDGKTGFINEVLTLEKMLVAETGFTLSLTSDSGDDIICQPTGGVCENTSDALFVALKLPWAFNVKEPESLDIEGIEYYFDCLVVGILFENACSGLATALILNDPVTGDAAVAFEEDPPNLACDGGSEAKLLSDESDPLISDSLGRLYTWSSTQLLREGAAIEEDFGDDLSIEIGWELLFHGGILGSPEYLCSGIYNVVMESGKNGYINELLTLGKTLIAETGSTLALVSQSGDEITCEGIKGCESTGDMLLVALKLPWALKIEEPESLDIEGVEYSIDCLMVGVLFEDTCSGLAIMLILNDSVTGDAAVAFEADPPNLACDGGSELVALSEQSDDLLVHVGGGLLSWS